MNKPERLIGLDVLRGLTVMLMITVNNPGSWSYIYPPLKHAEWNGCTPTDLVFPFFLFCVGTAMYFAFKKYNHKLTTDASKKIIKRSILIFLIGLGLNAFPFVTTDYSNLRIMGVLQRIGIAYGIASFMVLSMNWKKLVAISTGVLLAYWAMLTQIGSGSLLLEGNLPQIVDRAILGDHHIYHGYGVPFDPEGLLSTISATMNVVFGYLIGMVVANGKSKEITVKKLFGIGTIATVVGGLWGMIFPLNKALWSSSYVVYTCGLATILLAIIIWLVDVKKRKQWAQPFLEFGMNPLFIFVLSGIVGRLFYLIRIGEGSLKTYIYNEWFVSWAGNMNGSLFFALTLITIYWLIAHVLYKKKIFIKI